MIRYKESIFGVTGMRFDDTEGEDFGAGRYVNPVGSLGDDSTKWVHHGVQSMERGVMKNGYENDDAPVSRTVLKNGGILQRNDTQSPVDKSSIMNAAERVEEKVRLTDDQVKAIRSILKRGYGKSIEYRDDLKKKLGITQDMINRFVYAYYPDGTRRPGVNFESEITERSLYNVGQCTGCYNKNLQIYKANDMCRKCTKWYRNKEEAVERIVAEFVGDYLKKAGNRITRRVDDYVEKRDKQKRYGHMDDNHWKRVYRQWGYEEGLNIMETVREVMERAGRLRAP